MANIVYPTELSLDGPWLIDSNQLLALDGLLQEYAPKMRAQVHQQLEEKAERDNARREHTPTHAQVEKEIIFLKQIYAKERQLVTLYLGGARSVTAETFSEAFKVPGMTGETVQGFWSNLEVGNMSVSISLRRGWNKKLTVEVKPKEQTLSHEIFTSLENWLYVFAPTRIKQLWVSSKGFFPSFFFGGSFLDFHIF
jgi:hypothetical protein